MLKPALFSLALISLSPASETTHASAAEGHAASHEEHHHHHHAAFFGGVTLHDGHLAPSFGLDYEYLVHPMGGVVGLFELVFGDKLQQIYGLGISGHPIPAVKIAVIPALESSHGHNAFLLRWNMEYAFHAGPLSIAPSASVDYVNSEIAFVGGLALGFGF
jgi:hypothetical protein